MSEDLFALSDEHRMIRDTARDFREIGDCADRCPAR